jgi:DNA/RNA-binding domain of Phe-tRNA-synthetase-like protein
MSRQYIISSEVFAKFPAYLRGVVIAHGVRNDKSPDALVQSLRSAEEALCARLSPENILTHPRIESWREAYRSIGIKPSDFRPSVEALTRRVLKRDPLPTISTLVDIGSLVSIQSILPIGAHAIDHVTQDIGLRLATGEEVFEPFGSDAVEHPQPGEIIFVEGNTVLTRRWTWRQAKHTLVVPETTAVEFNVDGLPPVLQAEVEKLCQEVATLVQQYCGGTVRWEVLSSNHPRIGLD